LESVALDTNLIVNFILKTQLTSRAKDILRFVFKSYQPVLFTNTVEESIFILVREELKTHGISKFYEQRDYLKRKGYSKLTLHKKFVEFVEDLNIPVLENRCGLDELVRNYGKI